MGNPLEVNIKSEPTGPDAPAPAGGAERPNHVPEKFWDAETGTIKTEALLNSYSELEQKQSAGEAPTEPEGQTEGAPEGGAEGDDEEGAEARRVAEEAGLDIPALESHWEEHGSLPEDTYEKLASVGVDKGLVDEFVQYRLSQGETLRSEMMATVGGEETVNKMVEWATKNYSEDKANAFNEAVNSKNRGQIELALSSLKADFDRANGVKPKLVQPTTGTGAKGARYNSLEEMLADQRNPKYRTDPAFRQSVIDKLSRSNI
ncbi:capsid assembly protein [Parasphingorhabdus sp.]|uniref:capsid assembly protein n=1 Tax=Parasphingorhabdus sp. TaxID=2709688 RepID=UPI003A932EAC